MTDSTGDTPGTNSPPPPPASTGPTSPNPPPVVVVKDGSGCWKIGGIVVAVVVVLGLLIGVGCTVLIGGAANEAAKEVQDSIGVASTTDYELSGLTCSTEQFLGARADGTITNKSDKERAFQITVSFTNVDGSLVSTDSTFTDKLNPGQSTQFEVLALEDPAPDFECSIKEVSYSIFGS